MSEKIIEENPNGEGIRTFVLVKSNKDSIEDLQANLLIASLMIVVSGVCLGFVIGQVGENV